MSANRNYISQIRKYLSGKLDARAMHELEKQALDDPFLMDALNGYEAIKTNQQQNLDDLTQRLNKRIYRHKRSIAWPAIAVAASLFLAISVGGLWLLHQQNTSKQNPKIVQNESAATSKSTQKRLIPTLKMPPLQNDLVVLKPAGSPTQIKQHSALKNKLLADKMQEMLSDTSNLLASGVAKNPLTDSTKGRMLNEVSVVGYPTQMKRSVAASAAVVNAAPQQLEGRVAGINIANKSSKSSDSGKVKLISGQVLSKSDGQPLPGVNVAVLGKNKTVATDAQGRFQIEASSKDELNFAYIGFNTKQVKVKRKDSLEVMLDENKSALAEVVVTGYGNQQNLIEAHPATGWQSFNRYLEEKAHLANGKTRVVQVSFNVNPDNSLSDFKITKSLNNAADEQAIGIIKQGPSWQHNQNGKPELVKIKIHFK